MIICGRWLLHNANYSRVLFCGVWRKLQESQGSSDLTWVRCWPNLSLSVRILSARLQQSVCVEKCSLKHLWKMPPMLARVMYLNQQEMSFALLPFDPKEQPAVQRCSKAEKSSLIWFVTRAMIDPNLCSCSPCGAFLNYFMFDRIDIFPTNVIAMCSFDNHSEFIRMYKSQPKSSQSLMS